jgi:maltooligosyltrehalose trehalohydrolase
MIVAVTHAEETTTVFRHGPAALDSRRWNFQIWAPRARQVELHLVTPTSGDRYLTMSRQEHGYWQAVAEAAAHEEAVRYNFRLNGAAEYPDPASRFQPEGVHGPSQLVRDDFDWQDGDWQGPALESYVIYELHTGTLTAEGTFDAVIPHLPYLKDLGVTVIELMPVAQFPGRRNWGFDGVYPFAAQNSYGGPAGLKRLVNACHAAGLGVCLDVVYNHLGPEGNYLGNFGPYFTDRYKTPWGEAINFDDSGSDHVRRFFIETALYWTMECHIDALRLDAVHAIFDQSAYHFLEELGDEVHSAAAARGRRVQVIPESALNDPRLVRTKEQGGYGLDAQWSDDFHHALRTLLTGERSGYYEDFGDFGQLAKAYREGFVYAGQYSKYRDRRFGAPATGVPAERFVVFSQNHDQVGNRMLGERLSTLVSFEQAKLAAGAVILSPFVPLLFMGEEYAESAPFLYFVEHSDAHLIEAVRRGRKQEFASFAWHGDPPDPQSKETFLQSKLNHRLYQQPGRHSTMRRFYKELLRLRRDLPALRFLSREKLEVLCLNEQNTLMLRRWTPDFREAGEQAVAILCFGRGAEERTVDVPLPPWPGRWRKLLDSTETAWDGPGGTGPEEIRPERDRSVAVRSSSVLLYQTCIS